MTFLGRGDTLFSLTCLDIPENPKENIMVIMFMKKLRANKMYSIAGVSKEKLVASHKA